MAEFESFLEAAGLYVFTVNAFPYGPFHGQRVKEEVYQPDWTNDERLRFTNRVADHLARLLPEGMEGSISTVPGTFAPLAGTTETREHIARNMIRHAAHLVEIERRTGHRIALAVEPEPSCMLETTEGAVEFFERFLFGAPAQELLGRLTGLERTAAEAALRAHLGLCYDACHAAVEFEDARSGFERLKTAGIRVTKLQITSALSLPQVDAATAELLQSFDDGVYLHQTVQRHDGRLTRWQDLPQALAALRAGEAGGEWRVHCHVPVFVANFGALSSTRDFLLAVLGQCRDELVSAHLEVETYTWDVLPGELRGDDKAQAIIRELQWTRSQLLA
jgi:hypothetical protein